MEYMVHCFSILCLFCGCECLICIAGTELDPFPFRL